MRYNRVSETNQSGIYWKVVLAGLATIMLIVALASVASAGHVQSWTYMRRVGANNSDPGCGSSSPFPYFCQDGGKFWAGYSVYNYPQWAESERNIFAGTQDTSTDGGLWWGTTKAADINWNITNQTGWYPAINLDEQSWNGGHQTGLHVQWMQSDLPNVSSARRQDDNGDGRMEEVRVWARSTVQAHYRYYAYALFYDYDAWICCDPSGNSGEINYSAYRVTANGDHAAFNGTRWLGKFYFTSAFRPAFRCAQSLVYPGGCIQ